MAEKTLSARIGELHKEFPRFSIRKLQEDARDTLVAGDGLHRDHLFPLVASLYLDLWWKAIEPYLNADAICDSPLDLREDPIDQIMIRISDFCFRFLDEADFGTRALGVLDPKTIWGGYLG